MSLKNLFSQVSGRQPDSKLQKSQASKANESISIKANASFEVNLPSRVLISTLAIGISAAVATAFIQIGLHLTVKGSVEMDAIVESEVFQSSTDSTSGAEMKQ